MTRHAPQTTQVLPIDAIREKVMGTPGPLVITAPTGSGKSTQVPRWLGARGTVYVIEPRRVACRALAQRVAHLEGSALGETVGYQVRGEQQSGNATRIHFVTPGIALRRLSALYQAEAVVLDELHERRLDVDLLLALLAKYTQSRAKKDAPQLVAMSATLDGPRVAKHLGATLLEAEGRPYPVAIRYHAGEESLPSPRHLADRVRNAIRTHLLPTSNGHAETTSEHQGDVLVFLPGQGEIRAVADAVRGLPFEVRMLHGGMSLKDQSRVFEPAKGRKLVLATNVAETSLTVPGIRVVIDSGLVRRTHYHRGRAHLALSPIATDAADQRAGRAGRVEAGTCIRLWARRATLAERTPPEIHRESLVPLVLAASAAGYPDIDSLPLLDRPKEHALSDATGELQSLGAIDEDGAATEVGKELFGLPIDASLGRLLIEARDHHSETVYQDIVDLVAALGTGRRMFIAPPKADPSEDPIRFDGCDAAALVRAVRWGGSGTDDRAVREARDTAKRLRRALGLRPFSEMDERESAVDPYQLCRVAIAADSRCAHVVRRRGKGAKGSKPGKGGRVRTGPRVFLASGGTELSLADESAAWQRIDPQGNDNAEARTEPPAPAVVVFDLRAFGTGKDRRLLATCASPCNLRLLQEMGLGEQTLKRAWLKNRKLRAEIETVYAGKSLGSEEMAPTGPMARQALAEVLKNGRLFREAIAQSRSRLDARHLAAALGKLSVGRDHGVPADLPAPPSFDEWLIAHIEDLGVESGEDLALLSADDFLAEDLAYELRSIVEDLYPREVSLGDVTYRVEFDIEGRRALLTTIRGGRSKPPPRSFLPKFPGLKVFAEASRSLHRIL